MFPHLTGDLRLKRIRPAAQGRPRVHEPFEHDRHEIDLNIGTFVEGELNDARIRGGGPDVAGNVVAAYDVQNDIGPFGFISQDVDEVLFVVVDDPVGPELGARLAPLRRAIGGIDPSAKRFGELNRRGANAPRPAVDQKRLARLEINPHEHIAPNRVK